MKGLSLVIPFHSRADYFDEMLNSLRALTVKPDEIIFVNNNAQDQMVDMVCQFKEDVEGMCKVLLVTCSTPGACAARNAGAKMASCEFIYFFDSDDAMSADFVGRVKTEIDREDADVYVFVTQIIKADGRTHVRRYGASIHPGYQILSAFLSTQSIVVRKAFLLDIGGWDESISYWNDWELGIRLLLHSPRMRYFPDISYHCIYEHSNSITGNSLSEHVGEIDSVLGIVYDELCSQEEQDALFLRKAIIAGKIKAEGDMQGAKSLYKKCFPMKPAVMTRLLASLLFHYTAAGIPGAWRIAVKMLRLKTF